jgi:hypothetical protein
MLSLFVFLAFLLQSRLEDSIKIQNSRLFSKWEKRIGGGFKRFVKEMIGEKKF